MRENQKSALVVGGGLSGLAAACRLIESRAYASVTLVEKRPFLGGRVFSFKDPKTDMDVDNAQHIFIGACRVFRDFLRKIAVPQKEIFYQKRFAMSVHHPKRGWARLSALPFLPPPWHMGFSFLRWKLFSFSERLKIARAMRVIHRMKENERLSLQGACFGDWLRDHGQTPACIQFFWKLLVEATLNTPPDACDASAALFVFQHGMLSSSQAANTGYFRGGQGLVAEYAAAYFEARGGVIRKNVYVDHFLFEHGRISGIRSKSGECLLADTVISSVPPYVLYPLLPPAIRHRSPFSELPRIAFSAILGVHLWYDRSVMDENFAALLESPAHWVFNKNENYAVDGPPYMVGVLQSAADATMDMKHDVLIKLMDGEIRKVFPRAQSATLLHARVVKEAKATMRTTPGFDALRPTQRSPVPDFFLAGDWTQTGWPSTMEGAVRAGEFAASAALDGLS